ncbi:hypothetical protein F3Y22_tig00112428pilonHSYRG00043 [Hibiscus syriacus]|uniref:Uncharacterized protein n=1 Tax=Hibiscus syriacus TaxID=106335 RepID=A0A6A2WYT2_HIBSY|nr:hypothetical protein F3Y22_tig00112428pilonHSYRG00043 [Hibiscus syriacus]
MGREKLEIQAPLSFLNAPPIKLLPLERLTEPSVLRAIQRWGGLGHWAGEGWFLLLLRGVEELCRGGRRTEVSRSVCVIQGWGVYMRTHIGEQPVVKIRGYYLAQIGLGCREVNSPGLYREGLDTLREYDKYYPVNDRASNIAIKDIYVFVFNGFLFKGRNRRLARYEFVFIRYRMKVAISGRRRIRRGRVKKVEGLLTAIGGIVVRRFLIETVKLFGVRGR